MHDFPLQLFADSNLVSVHPEKVVLYNPGPILHEVGLNIKDVWLILTL